VSILIDKGTRLLVQGITGRDGAFHTRQMLDYATRVVAGVTPGKGGETVHDVPVFDGVAEAVAATRANASVIYVPAPFAADAVFEAADAGIPLIVCITEGIPVRDAMLAWHHVTALRDRNGHGKPRLIGPNCPGLLAPGIGKIGIMPGAIARPGPVGVVSRSGTLTYEVVHQLSEQGLGQSTCLGIGGDPIVGTSFIDVLELFERDPRTEAVVLIGEIGGSDEEEAAQFIRRHVRKPVVAFVAGQTAPPGKRMGHAGAIVSGGAGTAAEKMAAFQAAGIPVARIPSEIPERVRDALARRRVRRAASRPASKPGAGRTRPKGVGRVRPLPARRRSRPAARRRAGRRSTAAGRASRRKPRSARRTAGHRRR
jgi:succinyl-CoA synthetase alpha subunit